MIDVLWNVVGCIGLVALALALIGNYSFVSFCGSCKLVLRYILFSRNIGNGNEYLKRNSGNQ